MTNLNTTKIKELQKKLGVTADGDWGPLTQAAFDKSLTKTVVGSQSPIIIGLQDYGIKEIDGSANNAKIMQYYADSHNSWVKDEDVAWCAAFVGACLERSKIASTRSLAARSYLTWSKETKTPKTGDIAVFRRGTNPTEGHVAFFIREEGANILVLGGNQSNSVSIASMPKTLLLSYRAV